jgi:fatty-acyl-CoA synthase
MEWYRKRRFGDLADDMAARFPTREALVFGERRWTFAKVAAEIDEAAKRLIAAGVGHGDHVALWLNNCPEWIFVAFAIHKIGAVLVPVNTRFRARDMAYVLKQSDARFLIIEQRSGPIDYLAMVREVVKLPAAGCEVRDPEFPELARVIALDPEPHAGTLPWPALAGSAREIPDSALAARVEMVDPDAPTFIMYTSGTTGFPKGVMHSHKLVPNIEHRGSRMGISRNDTILNYLPLFHAFSYSEGALMSLVTGARQILTQTFDPSEALDLIEREKVTIVHGFEAHAKSLAEAQEAKPRNVSTLRTGIWAAGMHSATPVIRKAARVLAPIRNVSGFGMTEIWIGVGLSSLDDDEQHRCETSGYPGLGFESRIVDLATGELCPPGKPGEIQVKGMSLMLGYYKKPVETAASYTPDGWFKTGDSGLMTEDGYLRFLGREKDMLKVGGENVDPMETEGLLLEHPAVQQVAMVGLPDARMGEVGVAYVERKPGASLEAEQVIGFCRGKVASFKIPRHVVFIDAFPMTESGKIKKAELRADARQRLGGAGT